MNKYKKREIAERIIIYAVFGFYTLLVLKMLFFSRTGEISATNFVPMKTIWDYLTGVSSFAFGNVVGNIFLFVPLGLYLSFLRNDKRIGLNMLVVLGATVIAEIIQFCLSIGIADIDDVILNCIGGFIGILTYKIIVKIVEDEKTSRTLFAVLSLMGLPVLLYLLFFIKMRFLIKKKCHRSIKTLRWQSIK